jgi:hypothetical protein
MPHKVHLASDARFVSDLAAASLIFCPEPFPNTDASVVSLDGGKISASADVTINQIAPALYDLQIDTRHCTLIVRDAPWQTPLVLPQCTGPVVLLSRRYFRWQIYHDGPLGLWNARGDCLAFLGAAQAGSVLVKQEDFWELTTTSEKILRFPEDDARSLAYRCVNRAIQIAYPSQKTFALPDATDLDALAILMCRAALGKFTVSTAATLPSELRRVCENAGVIWQNSSALNFPRLPVHLVKDARVALVEYFAQFGSVIPEKLAARLKR